MHRLLSPGGSCDYVSVFHCEIEEVSWACESAVHGLSRYVSEMGRLSVLIKRIL